MLNKLKEQMDKVTNEAVQYLVTKNEVQGSYLTRVRLFMIAGLFVFGWITLYTTASFLLDWDYQLFMNGTSFISNLIHMFLAKLFELVTILVSCLLVSIFWKARKQIKQNRNQK